MNKKKKKSEKEYYGDHEEHSSRKPSVTGSEIQGDNESMNSFAEQQFTIGELMTASGMFV